MVTTNVHKPTPDARLAPVAGEIAAQLGETELEARRQIVRALRVIGEERTRAVVAQALDVEASGGLMLPDGSRRRTRGGVFFHMLRHGVDRQERYRIFQPRDARQKASEASPRAQAPQPAVAPFDWATFRAAATEAMSEPGEATTVKLTVIGRPGKIVERGDVVLVAMRSEKAPSLPKGVPVPSSPMVDYMVLVGMKQWRKVAEALAADFADKLLIEGYPIVQPEFAGITVYATSATTTGIQAGKRAAQTATTR